MAIRHFSDHRAVIKRLGLVRLQSRLCPRSPRLDIIVPINTASTSHGLTDKLLPGSVLEKLDEALDVGRVYGARTEAEEGRRGQLTVGKPSV